MKVLRPKEEIQLAPWKWFCPVCGVEGIFQVRDPDDELYHRGFCDKCHSEFDLHFIYIKKPGQLEFQYIPCEVMK